MTPDPVHMEHRNGGVTLPLTLSADPRGSTLPAKDYNSRLPPRLGDRVRGGVQIYVTLPARQCACFATPHYVLIPGGEGGAIHSAMQNGEG